MGAAKKMSDKDILSKVADDLIVLLADEPFYVYILTQMRKVIANQVPVAGVSVIEGKITLYINPKGYLNYTKPERLFILKHEVLHIIFIHYLRRGGKDPELFNLAADIAINQLIETDMCQMPPDAFTPAHYDLPLKESAETYYNILMKRPGKIEIPIDLLETILGEALSECPDCEGTGQAQEKDDKIKGVIRDVNAERKTITVEKEIVRISAKTQIRNIKMGDIHLTDLKVGMYVEVTPTLFPGIFAEADIVQEANPEQKQNPQDGQGEEKQQTCPSCGGSGKQHNHGNGSSKAPGFARLHPMWDLSSDVSEQLAESQVRSIIKEAHQKARGKVPGAIQKLVDDFLEATVPWKQIFRQFIAKARSTSKYATWRKQNRRLGDQVMGQKKDNKLLIAVAVDTSGSITNDQLQAFLGEIRRMFISGANIVMIECGAAISAEPRKFDRNTAKSPNFSFSGGGGTDFRPVFDYLDGKEVLIKGVPKPRDKKLFPRDPDALIFLTDGIGPAPHQKPSYPTLWCITADGRKPATWGNELKLVV